MSERVFEYHPDAITEAHEAFLWYRERSPAASGRFRDELIRARKIACEQPQRAIPYLHGTRCVIFDRFPYGLVFVEQGRSTIGVAVVHLHRRPGYWRKRT
ncbi:MAG: hypothetical protein AAGF31_01055 [Planctomycetota bacterium]